MKIKIKREKSERKKQKKKNCLAVSRRCHKSHKLDCYWGFFLLSYLYRFICLRDAIGLNKIKINPQVILICDVCCLI